MPRMSNVEPLTLQAAKDGKGDEAGEQTTWPKWVDLTNKKTVDLHGVYTYVIYILFGCI